MLAITLVFTGHFAFFTYLRPFLETVSRETVNGVSLTLLVFGIGSFLGTSASGWMLKTNLRLTLWLVPLILAALTVVAISFGASPFVIGTVAILWGFFFGTVPVGWSTWLTQTVPDEAETGGGLLVAAIQVSHGHRRCPWRPDLRRQRNFGGVHAGRSRFAACDPGDTVGRSEDRRPMIEEPKEVADRHPWRLLATLSALLGFASISNDVYLPAMPTMAQSLHATPGSIEWTISGYLIGFSLGQLFWGPVGDRYGRRIPVAAGLILFLIGATGCAMAGSGTTLIVFRVIQALGACAGVVLARAMVRDLYEGDRAAQMLSTLMTVMAIAPLVGPILGGQILGFAGWRHIFWTLDVVGLLTLIAVMRLPETLPEERT